MENTSSKASKILYFFLGIVLLVLAGEGIYYFYLKSSKNQALPTPSSVSDCQNGNCQQPIKSEKYVKGTEFIEEINGEKHLLVIEGTAEKINSQTKTITIKRGKSFQDVSYQESDSIILIDSENRLEQKEISFSDIKIGDFVAYNPVDEKVNRLQAVWLVEHQDEK